MKYAKCWKAWECQPRLIVGKQYKFVRSFCENGEGYFRLQDDDGVCFDAPDAFFEYNESLYPNSDAYDQIISAVD